MEDQLTPEQMNIMMGATLKPDQAAAISGHSTNLMSQFIGGVQAVPGQIGAQFKSGVEDVKSAEKDSMSGQMNPIEAGMKMGSGVATAISSPLAPITSPLQAGINWLGDKISNNPLVQRFSNSEAGQVTARAAQDIAWLDNAQKALAEAKEV